MKIFIKLFFIIYIFTVPKANAQTYIISFAGSGASTSVSSVEVDNLTEGTSLTLNGSDILRLNFTTSINSIKDKQTSELKIYPNPMTDNSILELYPPISGDATISVYDMTGKLLTQIQSKLDKGLQEYHLSGLTSGSYLISIQGSTYKYSGKLLVNSKETGSVSIEKVSNNQAVYEKKVKADSKGLQSTVDMAYTTGDRLLFVGLSGNYSTVKIDIPTSDETITFNFIACTDYDNNNYPIVEIGTQVWMAENLKTTKYNDGTAIPNETDNTAWRSLTTGAYSDYDNTPSTSITYGRLYNWYTVDNNANTKVASNGGKNVCPTSWHVPTDAEWSTLTTYLGGESVAAGKLKETGTTHWTTPNTGATNESGFTALPSGYHDYDGTYDGIGCTGYWWSTTEYSTIYTFDRCMYCSHGDIFRYVNNLQSGYAVRCLRDD
ncbi:MAG: FISUMP domain-containing protein [Bacteroidales bacterium]